MVPFICSGNSRDRGHAFVDDLDRRPPKRANERLSWTEFVRLWANTWHIVLGEYLRYRPSCLRIGSASGA
jgi:hypothetical protein